jgi:hypothetical protein
LNVQRSTFSVQRSAFNVQRSTFNVEGKKVSGWNAMMAVDPLEYLASLFFVPGAASRRQARRSMQAMLEASSKQTNAA